MVAALPALAMGTAGTAATATAAATAASAGLFGIGGTFSLMQTASTLGTFMGLGSTLMGGSAEKAMYQSQAQYDELRARQEKLRGQMEATQIKSDLTKSIATANARGAASGIDISSGSPVTAVQASIDDANTAWSMAKYNADMGAEAYRANANTNRLRGNNAVRSARSQAMGIATDFMGKQYDRGMRF